MRPALIVTAALLVFGACSGGETSPPPLAPAQTATPERPLATAAAATATHTATPKRPLTTAAPPTATPTANAAAPAALDKPPAAIARAGSASVAMGLGSYCWESGGLGLCADAVGIITGTTALEVGRGEAVTIAGELARTEFAVESARIRPVEGEPAYEGEDSLAWTPAAQNWPGEWSALDLDAGDEGLGLTAQLPAGRYLVNLSLRFPQGDASYGLVLDVR